MRRFLASCLAVLAWGARAADIPSVERAILEGTNRFRHEQGVGVVRPDSMLDRTARDFAEYLARTDRFDHEADGRTPAIRARAHGYDYCLVAENIAYQFDSRGFTTPALARGLIQGWKDSPGHRRNMLDARAVDTGVAVAQSAHSGRFYAVQMFGRRRAACR
ncbi:MAG TPA: CAP domain-containing protein [Usitatibacter sp.]|nr:CAP domain-containing protein [Usitatibacter sp.]